MPEDSIMIGVMKEKLSHFSAYTANYFFLFGAVSVLTPFLPLILQNKGMDPSSIGFLMGSYELFSIFGLLILGRAYDRFNSPRRTLVFIILTTIGLFFILVRFSSLSIFIPAALGVGFLIKSPPSLTDAMYGQTMKTPRESYGKSRQGGSLGYTVTLGIIHITGLVSGNRPYSVFTGFALMLALAAGAIRFLPTMNIHSRPEDEHLPFFTTLKTFPSIYWLGLGIALLNTLGISGHNTFFSLLLNNRFHTSDIGAFWAIGPVLEIPLFFFSGFLLKKFSLKRLWLIGLAAGIIRMQVYSLADSLAPLYYVQICHGFSFGINHLCMVTLINHTTSARSRGIAMSLYTAAGMGVPLFLGGILGGILLKFWDFPLLYQVFSFFPLLGAVVAILFLKGHREITSS